MVAGVMKRQAASVITTLHVDAVLDQQPAQLGGLVGGDAAGDAQQDAVAGCVPMSCVKSLIRKLRRVIYRQDIDGSEGISTGDPRTRTTMGINDWPEGDRPREKLLTSRARRD